MRTPREWWLRLKAIKEERIKAAELDRNALKEVRTERLRSETQEVGKSLESIGFKTPSRYACDTEKTQSTQTIVGPNNEVYRLTVFYKGGYRMEKL